MGDSFLWDEVEIVFNMSVFSTSTVARLSFSVTRTCIAEKRLIEHLDWGSPCNHHQAIDLVPFICQVCFDQNRCYVTIVLLYFVISFFSQGMDEQREEVRAAYLGLREPHPALPEQLRDFQVGPWDFEGEGFTIEISSGRYCRLRHQWQRELSHHGGLAYGLWEVAAHACDWTPHATW